ncbi:hypothetical protein N7468_003724 [Penicillium chermesinum]|uniref:Uncharacterized protein n=1 Tax=Penicillium chermesinum TaxID=63820 RepID=A0A9W9P753_9EURO|nr:uncharacterized protein N7468_003724 [Penicillium chermesinum]KAJ5239105.1 hypothetical protein N7468_003724 [Penicillium chermesinum]KAJ6164745.1 hypothetical protein N7470_003417 [Penicillium chermesinum]
MGNRDVQSAPCQMGLRPETVAEFTRLLYIQPKYDARSASEYTIRYDNNDRVLFTVTGHKYTDRGVREFRDASGLPMFECQRTWPAWRWGKPWRVRLPGDEADLVDIKLGKGAGHNFDLTFRNALATDVKREEDRLVTVAVRKESFAFCRFSASVGGRKVMDFRESVEKNRTIHSIAASSASGYVAWRSIIEVHVADGFDFALASLISIMLCDSYFSSAAPKAKTIAAREKRLNPIMA